MQMQQQQTQQHAHVTSSPASALAATLPTTKLLSDASDSVLYYCADAMDAYEGYLLSQLPQHADQQDKVKMFAQQLFEALRTNATAKLEVFQQRAVERCFAIPAKLRTALRRLEGGEEPMTEEQEQIAQEAALDEEASAPTKQLHDLRFHCMKCSCLVIPRLWSRPRCTCPHPFLPLWHHTFR